MCCLAVARLLTAETAAQLGSRGEFSKEAASSQGAWTSLAPLALARQEIAAAVLNGTVYVAGGLIPGSTLRSTRSVEVLVPGASAWQPGPELPRALDHLSMATYQSRVFVLGGFEHFGTVQSEVWSLGPGETEWRPEPPLPHALGAGSAAVVAGRLVFVGGVDGTHQERNELWQLAPDGSRWEEMAPMPTAREHLTTAVLGGKLFAIGGRSHDHFRFSEVEVWDPALNQWHTAEPLLAGRSGLAAAALGSQIWVAGGEIPGVFDDVEVYGLADGQWLQAPDMPSARHGLAMVEWDGGLLTIAGGLVAGWQPSRVVEGFLPQQVFADGFETGTLSLWAGGSAQEQE